MSSTDGTSTYPVVSTQGVVSVFAAVAAGESPDVDRVVVQRSLEGLGVEGPIDFLQLAADLEAKEVLWTDFVARKGRANEALRNEFEATYSSEIYRALAGLPIPVLDDKDFWRWLIVGPLRWWVDACDGGEGKKLPNESKGLGGDSNFRRNPVTRAYFRGRIASDLADPDIGSAYGNAAAAARGSGGFADRDFLKSHILGVLVGNVPTVAGAFIRTSSDPYLPPGDPAAGELGVRQYVKYFTRLRSEIAWTDYSAADADALGRELRERFDRSSTTPVDGD